MEEKSVNIFYSELNLLTRDNTSGSNELLVKLNNLILKNLEYIDFNSSFFQNLYNTFQSFESIQKYLRNLESCCSKNDSKYLYKYLKKINNENNEIYDKIYAVLKANIFEPVSIITLSNSETVSEIIKRINRSKLLEQLIICESRPQFEGKSLANKLVSERIKIEFIVEARIPEYVKCIDFGLIGSDKILKNGNVINKIGSKILALSCSYYSKPFYVVSDLKKISDELHFHQMKKSREEIWENAPENVNISNYYFEEVEKSLITKIFTD